MTISSTTVKVSYSGNGSTTVFAYTFKILDDDEIQVIIRSSTGTETVKTKTTHYTVSGVGSSAGGNITFLTAPSASETVVLRRLTTQTQETDYIANDPFPADSHEDALDRITMVAQEIQEELGRAIKLSKTNTMTSTEFTVDATDRANKILAFDTNGEISVTQELGTYQGNWATATTYYARDIIKDTSNNNIYIANTAHTSTGSQPISSNADVAKWDLLVDAASATSSATAAAASAATATTQATLATTNGAAQVTLATAQVALATTQATNAATSASTATTQATNAASSATAAAASAASAAVLLDTFDDIYLGAYATNPTLDNDGGALTAGDLYFNTVSSTLQVYSGSAWQTAAISSAGFATLTGVETLTNKTLTLPTIDNIKIGYSTTATAAGTTTLTSASNYKQYFTGSTTQTIVLPVVTTLTLGHTFEIHNNSSGSLTVNSSGSNLVGTVQANVTAQCTCILASGTTAASWDFDVTGFTSAVPTTRGGTGLTSIGSSLQVLRTNSGATGLEFATISSGTSWQSIVTAATLSAVAGNGYWINTTSNACTVTLPASASNGDTIILADYARTWGTNAVTINQNSLNFQGNTTPNPIYNTNGQSVTCVYSGATQGWIPTVDDDVTLETPQAYSVDFLVIAGGGGGGSNSGGGGAGGYRTSTQTVSIGTVITVTVGDGGAGGTSASSGTNGSNSSISGSGLTTITSTGGGGGGGNGLNGNNGGSGGGGGNNGGTSAAGSGNTPSTSPSQGNNGGSSSGAPYGGGGGGGASAVGANKGATGGAGGAGTASSITGSSVTRAGGGGGGGNAIPAGSGGSGGGGNGTSGGVGIAGTANTGGGGGGGSESAGPIFNGGAGGKGVVILSVPTASYSGTSTGSPTITTSGSNTIMQFTGSGSYTG